MSTAEKGLLKNTILGYVVYESYGYTVERLTHENAAAAASPSSLSLEITSLKDDLGSKTHDEIVEIENYPSNNNNTENPANSNTVTTGVSYHGATRYLRARIVTHAFCGGGCRRCGARRHVHAHGDDDDE